MITDHILGYILTEDNSPLANVEVKLAEKFLNVSAYSKNDGSFEMTIPPSYPVNTAVINAGTFGFLYESKRVSIGDKVPPVMFKLKRDERVMGMPRLLFVILAGCLGVAMVACAACCYSCCFQKVNPRDKYSFKVLQPKDRKLFDEEDGEDVKLFKDSNEDALSKPYYDEEDIPMSDTDSDDDVVLMNANNRDWRPLS